MGAIRAVGSYEAGKQEWARRKREKQREKQAELVRKQREAKAELLQQWTKRKERFGGHENLDKDPDKGAKVRTNSTMIGQKE